jgi:hypothetical protein
MDLSSSPPTLLTFNDLLLKAEANLKFVRLMRHKDNAALPGRTIYELWRDNPAEFERYQAEQDPTTHAKVKDSKQWASFVVTPEKGTMFVGLYDVHYIGPSEMEMVSPTTGEVFVPKGKHVYKTLRNPVLSAYEGRLYINWGAGHLAWCQYADRNDKPIIEIKQKFSEPAFPGYLSFIVTVTQVPTLPLTWVEALRSAKGVYVLTCPRTKELYVGSATGVDGFYGRWCEYARDGHGGNIQLKNRDRSEYQVTILEVAGSSLSTQEIWNLESHWKDKLQTRKMGLNSN